METSLKTRLALISVLSAALCILVMFLAVFSLSKFYAEYVNIAEFKEKAVSLSQIVDLDVSAKDLATYAEKLETDYAFFFKYEHPNLTFFDFKISGNDIYISETDILAGLPQLSNNSAAAVTLTSFENIKYKAVYAKILGDENSYAGIIINDNRLDISVFKMFMPKLFFVFFMIPFLAFAGYILGGVLTRQIMALMKSLKDKPFDASEDSEHSLTHVKMTAAYDVYYALDERKAAIAKEVSKTKKSLEQNIYNKKLLIDSAVLDMKYRKNRMDKDINLYENLFANQSGLALAGFISSSLTEFLKERLDELLKFLQMGKYEEMLSSIKELGDDISKIGDYIEPVTGFDKNQTDLLLEGAVSFVNRLIHRVKIELICSEKAKLFESSPDLTRIVSAGCLALSEMLPEGSVLQIRAQTRLEQNREILIISMYAENGKLSPTALEFFSTMNELMKNVYNGHFGFTERREGLYCEYLLR